MQKIKNKATSMIALLLTLLFATSFIAVLPLGNAVTYREFIYVGISPKVVGVGQEAIIVTWTADMPPDVGETSGAVPSPNGRAAWNNPAVVTVMKPDGTNETIKMPRTDPVGATWYLYTPQMVGEYSMQAYFPGEFKNSSTVSAYYAPDYSPVANFTVTQEPTPTWQGTPLPNDYWTRPLNSANHDWYVLGGNWLAGNNQNYPAGSSGATANYAYGKGPETSHILWTKQYYIGGLMEERFGAIGYQTQHYQGISWSGIALNGIIHYTPRNTAHGAAGWAAIDLYTGDELFQNYSSTRPSFGQVYSYESPNQHGGFTYLWRTSSASALPEIIQVPYATLYNTVAPNRTQAVQTINRTATTNSFGTIWEMLDGYTRETICYIANVTSGGTGTVGKDGSILRYNLVNYGTTASPNYYLTLWNSSIGTMVSSQLGTGYWQWRPAGGTFGGSNAYLGGLAYNYVHDGNDFFSFNVSIPNINGPRNSRSNQTGTIRELREDEYVIIGTSGVNDEQGVAPAWFVALSLEPGRIGNKLWEISFTPPSGADSETVSLDMACGKEKVAIFSKARTLEYFGYSLETGQLLWTTEPEAQFHYYGMSESYWNGTLYSYGYGGVLYAYDVKTGNLLWKYEPTSIGTESAYGGVYTLGIGIIADAKLYTISGEHSPTQPLYRGPNLRCIDAVTGKEIWKILGFFGGMSPTSSNIIMADGILIGLNHFDNQLYAFGKGPSATTVTTANDISVLGNKVMVKGTVTDQSTSGRRDPAGVLQFSLKGTPAISDEDMQAWMEYKFMQQAKPTNAKGVEVSLSAIDPNGNLISIGTTTSDMDGNYALPYTPEVPGNYQIFANFAGSKSYGPSSATTYLLVEDAPAATVAPTPEPVSVADQYFLPATIGIILAIVIIGIVIILVVLRKRP